MFLPKSFLCSSSSNHTSRSRTIAWRTTYSSGATSSLMSVNLANTAEQVRRLYSAASASGLSGDNSDDLQTCFAVLEASSLQTARQEIRDSCSAEECIVCVMDVKRQNTCPCGSPSFRLAIEEPSKQI
ncbi:hypothetical protein JOB18_004099 [Solea senegalensis]|uniref:Uncharacterized protein n=1 Tax=Solea senegalensis TaxID=28829 RepID=A0AAV6RU54_SOLSE|nr:hypothetical protein JOB18_004099 [Solea senegalensis]